MALRKSLDNVASSRPAFEKATWQQILRWSAIDAYRQQRRWNRDRLGVMTDVAEEIRYSDISATQALEAIEWHLLLEQVLNAPEVCVMDQIYWQTATQRQAARVCRLSQPRVHRVHGQAVKKLRRALR